MFVGPQRVRYLIEENKEKLLKEVDDYLDELCEGDIRIKSKMKSNPRVIATVLAQFIKKHQGELGVHALELDEIDLADTLTPMVIDYLQKKDLLTSTAG